MASLFTGLRPWQHQVLQEEDRLVARALHPAGGPPGRWVRDQRLHRRGRLFEGGRLRPGVRPPGGPRQGRGGRRAARADRRPAGGSSGSTSPSRRRPTSTARGSTTGSTPAARPPRRVLPNRAGALLRSRRAPAAGQAAPLLGDVPLQRRLGGRPAGPADPGPAVERRVGPHAAGGDLHARRGVRREGADPERRQPRAAAPGGAVRDQAPPRLPAQDRGAARAADRPPRASGPTLVEAAGGEVPPAVAPSLFQRAPGAAALRSSTWRTAPTSSRWSTATISSSGSRASRRREPDYYRRAWR